MNSISEKKHKKEIRSQLKRLLISLLITVLLVAILAGTASASVNIDLGNGEDNLGIIELLFTVTALALAPSILILMTTFTRFIIVLSFARNALGTQQSPPNQVLTGISIFLTLFVMAPVISQINEQAYQPYREGALTQEQFFEEAQVPLKEFMLKQTYTDHLNMFLDISRTSEDLQIESTEDLTKIGLEVIVPSFITSELKRAFNIGFLLFIPFLIIDIVVSSTLMSMGMVMLPPSMIALPFKIMMFVLVDGWKLLFENLVRGVR